MNIRNELRAGRHLLSDGAMGTQIYASGVDVEQSFEDLNLTHPEVVLGIHRAYLAAGADMVETNTFGASPLQLQRWGLEDRTTEINRAGALLARTAADEAGRAVLVAGSVGPLGSRLAPLGSLKSEDAYVAFHTQITALVAGGVDLLILETFADLLEIEQAIRAARAVCDLPVIASMSFNREGRTLTGATPESAARRLIDLNVDVLGANCSTGPRGVQEVVARYRAVLTELGLNTPISAMPNAGYPETRGERLFYPASAEYFGQYAQRLIEAGASIVGGCCGTTPEHVAAMRRTVDAMDGAARTTAVVSARPVASEPAATAAPIESALATALRNRTFITTVELEPPKSADTTELEANARMLRDAGATVLDVSDMPMARMRMAGMAAALKVQMAAGIETVLHFPVRGRNLLRVQGDLLAAHALGVRNLFVTMGDPAAIGDYPQAFDNHDIVPTGLVQLIKSQFNAGQDSAGTSIGEACRFVVGVAANLTPGDLDKEARLLKKKIECGADFALTQPVFDAAHARRFLARYAELFGALELPLLVGILPLASVRHAVFLKNEVPGMMVPDTAVARMEQAGDQAREEGVRMAGELLTELRPLVRGVYFIPAFRRYDNIARLIRQVTQA
jgi:methionine synthase I (cobalamin-dependent)/5,10-methylenetetrahydrofolate reductase